MQHGGDLSPAALDMVERFLLPEPHHLWLYMENQEVKCMVGSYERKEISGTWANLNISRILWNAQHTRARVANPEHAIVPTTDWYGPHLAEEAVSLTLERTKSPTLFIGGGTTGEAAVCDQPPHMALAQKYRDLEMCARANALSRRPTNGRSSHSRAKPRSRSPP